jgi:hypothetical protein
MSIASELEWLKDGRGFINPPKVHDWAASHPESALHHHLDWDDAKAGYEHRLSQIRRLIQLYVVDMTGDRKTISLVRDRHEGGGYRYIGPVLSNAELRASALREAFAEYRRWQRRYRFFREFGPIFVAADQVERDLWPDDDKGDGTDG